MHNSWRTILLCLFLAIPITAIQAHNHDYEKPIETAQQLVEWCQYEVEQRYLARDQQPRNWRISHVRKGNYLKVKLKFRIYYQEKSAVCRIRIGAQQQYAVYQESPDESDTANTSVQTHNHEEEKPIETAQQLVEWCQYQVEKRYLVRNQTPSNWRISHSRKGNYLNVKLKFLVEYENKSAVCQIRQGAQQQYAIFQETVNE